MNASARRVQLVDSRFWGGDWLLVVLDLERIEAGIEARLFLSWRARGRERGSSATQPIRRAAVSRRAGPIPLNDQSLLLPVPLPAKGLFIEAVTRLLLTVSHKAFGLRSSSLA